MVQTFPPQKNHGTIVDLYCIVYSTTIYSEQNSIIYDMFPMTSVNIRELPMTSILSRPWIASRAWCASNC